MTWEGTKIASVVVCMVSLKEMDKMEEKAQVLSGMGEPEIFVTFEGKTLFAVVVNALNEGVSVDLHTGGGPEAWPHADSSACWRV